MISRKVYGMSIAVMVNYKMMVLLDALNSNFGLDQFGNIRKRD